MTTLIRRFLNDEGGATSIEYGLIITMIFLGIVGALQLFAGGLDGLFGRTMSALSDVIGTGRDDPAVVPAGEGG